MENNSETARNPLPSSGKVPALRSLSREEIYVIEQELYGLERRGKGIEVLEEIGLIWV